MVLWRALRLQITERSVRGIARRMLLAALAMFLLGCGKSKEEVAKEDAQGKVSNEQGMNRMVQEQTEKQAAQQKDDDDRKRR